MPTKAPKSSLEEAFLAAWKQEFPNLPEPVRQHPIRNPLTGRDWRLDFSWPEAMLFCELQGSGRHQKLMGQAKDYERQNYLTLLGWRGVYFNAINLRDTVGAVTITAEVLCKAKEVE